MRLASKRFRRVAPSLVLVVIGASCGRAPVQYSLGPEPTTTTTEATSSRSVLLPTTAGSPRTSVGGAATSAGSSRSTTSTIPAKPWVPVAGNLVGVSSECGNVSYVSARPNDDGVMVGIALRGLFVSVGGAPTWQPLGAAKGSAAIDHRVSSVVYDPTTPGTWYESGAYGTLGAFRTTDGGTSFTPLGDVRHLDSLSVDLSDPARATMLAGGHESNLVHRSTNGGKTWTDVGAALGSGVDVGFTSSVHVVNANTHLVGSRTGAKSGVYRTVDGGATWSQVFVGPVIGRMLVAKDGTWYWLLDNGGGVIRSTDAGVTWTKAGGAGRLVATTAGLVELPDGRLASFGSTIVVSADRGTTWRAFGSPLPYLPVGMTYSAAQKAFYIWRFDCDRTNDNPVPADGILRMDASTL